MVQLPSMVSILVLRLKVRASVIYVQELLRWNQFTQAICLAKWKRFTNLDSSKQIPEMLVGRAGKEKKTWFFSVKLGKTAQPSSKSAGLSWLSRLRRGLCHCLLACLRSAISSKIFEGWLVSKHKKLYAASCGANCKNYKSKETPVLVCHCKNEWSSTSQKWAMYTT